MDRGVYTNNVYGTNPSSRPSLYQLAKKDLWLLLKFFVGAWLMLLGGWNSVACPLLKISPISPVTGALLILGGLVGITLFNFGKD